MERKALESHGVSGVAIDLLGQLHSFFTRIEAKSSVILGVNTGMIRFLAAKISPTKVLTAPMPAALLPLALIAASLVQLYRCSFPQLKGGRESLVSFKDIAKRTQERGTYIFHEADSGRIGPGYARTSVGELRDIDQQTGLSEERLRILRAGCVILWGLAIIIFVA